ncbi:DNA polymerase alpha subunit B isoform X2 [Aricia agestis]|uniref:DNA polymerase alpha subunit B isoform X2 n=1 Tax=Aricia agestis TaxID=91739 RepID=UPI001C205037|nr:DNA polymerase alpha subunit B isoform X2 [Aricia agestis]
MATEELVTEQFQFLGIDLAKEVIKKCVNLCEEYDIDAEAFIEQWMAFSLTHLNGASPTLQNLELLAKREFSKQAARPNVAHNDKVLQSTESNIALYGLKNSQDIQPENAVLSNYITGSPKEIKMESMEDQQLQKVKNELCPAMYTPIDHSGTFNTRTNQLTVVHSFGDDKSLNLLAQPNSVSNILDLNIKQVPNDDGEIYTKAMFGFELLHEKSSIIDNHISYLSQCIMKKMGFNEQLSSVRHKSQTEILVAGRIDCDADARLNPKSVILQGTWEESLSQSVPVDLDSLKQYSLFPGQVVVLRGVNPRGDKFIPNEVYADASRPIPDPKVDMMNVLNGTLSLVISSGPYTTSNNLAYAPLKDLITYINDYKPHVVLMTGPFLDCEHTKVKDNTMAETFKSFFDKLLDSLAEISTSSPLTKIYIVSSCKDAFHVNIYPTPPYSSKKKHPNIHFLPDPANLNINGVTISITSIDMLMNISQEEISLGMGGDKLSRLASHVIRQAGWSARGADAGLWAAHAQLPHTPHVLVLPSNFRYFIKNVEGCVVVNPEHLTKGTGGGTFARMLVSNNGNPTIDIAAQIVRI